MAKPIEAIPQFRGKAAVWINNYLKNRQPDPARQQRVRQHLEAAKRIKPLVRD
jgi:hypothetical protein